jgi:hypothetical protein
LLGKEYAAYSVDEEDAEAERIHSEILADKGERHWRV